MPESKKAAALDHCSFPKCMIRITNINLNTTKMTQIFFKKCISLVTKSDHFSIILNIYCMDTNFLVGQSFIKDHQIIFEISVTLLQGLLHQSYVLA